MTVRAHLEDMHVHSTFSDDARGTIAENLGAARARGLARVTCVEHVRCGATWVPDFVAVARREARAFEDEGLVVRVGVEAKMLDARGALDLPPVPPGVVVYVADHQYPFGAGHLSPRQVREGLRDGSLTVDEIVDALVGATLRAMERHEGVVLAHLFSILPKVGLGEDAVPDRALDALAACARERSATVEVSEKWLCPSVRALATFLAHGVPLVASTDAHVAADVGRYEGYALDALARAREAFDAA